MFTRQDTARQQEVIDHWQAYIVLTILSCKWVGFIWFGGLQEVGFVLSSGKTLPAGRLDSRCTFLKIHSFDSLHYTENFGIF